MDMEYVRTEVCTERHQRNREELKTLETRVNNHGKELDALSVDFAEHVATQAEINRQTLEQLKVKRLYDQLVLTTEKALSYLRFTGTVPEEEF